MKKTIRTIAFMHGPFPFGGAETVTLQLCRQLHLRGYKCYVFATQYNGHLLPADESLDVIVLPNAITAHGQNMSTILHETKVLGIDLLIVAYGQYAPIMADIKALSTARVLYIWHGVPLFEVTMRLSAGGGSLWMHIHRIFTRVLKERLLHTYTKRCVREYRAIACGCDAMVTLHSEYARHLGNLLEENKVPLFSIPNFIADSQFENIVELNKQKEILYCGRLDRSDKRVDQLLAIWRKAYRCLPDWQLVIVGDGPARSELERWTVMHRLPRVRFEGWQNDTASFFRQASIICLTSDIESYGMCLIEGMAHGCVPFAFDCSAGVRYIVSEAGFLFKKGDVKAYANQLVYEATHPKQLQQHMCVARQSAERFRASAIMPQWENIFKLLSKIPS